MHRYFLLALPLISFGLALPAAASLEERGIENRAGILGPGIINGLVSLITGKNDFDPCLGYRDIFRGNPSVYYSTTKYGTAEASICHINSTKAYEEEVKIESFTPDDAAVAKCLLNLHYTTPFACITTKGSVCDKNYLATGGRVVTARLNHWGKGESDGNKIAVDQNSAGALAIDTLIGEKISQGAASVRLYFWDPTGNHAISEPNGILLDFKGPSSPSC